MAARVQAETEETALVQRIQGRAEKAERQTQTLTEIISFLKSPAP